MGLQRVVKEEDKILEREAPFVDEGLCDDEKHWKNQEKEQQRRDRRDCCITCQFPKSLTHSGQVPDRKSPVEGKTKTS